MNEVLYLFHTNIFCITAEGRVVPAEMSLARMSLRQGVEETYNVFIEPGPIPKGYRADCTENSNATQKIPLDLAMFNGNYQEIMEDVLEFLLSLSDFGDLHLCTAFQNIKDRTRWYCPGSWRGWRRTWPRRLT